MARYGDLYVNNVTGERAVVLRGDEDAPGEPMLVHLHVYPDGGGVRRAPASGDAGALRGARR